MRFLAMASGTGSRGPLEDLVPVEPGQDMTLELVHAPALLRLIEWEGLGGFVVVVELGQHQLAVAGDQGAGAITPVERLGRASVHDRKEVGDQNWGLLAHCGPGLGVGCVGGVAEGEDVVEPSVLKSVLVDLEPALGIHQFALPDAVGRRLGRDDVNHVEVLDLEFHGTTLEVRDLEGGLVAWTVDGDQIVLIVDRDAVSVADLMKCLDVFLDAKEHGAGRHEVNFGSVEESAPPEVVAGEVHDLLRCATTLHGGVGLSEERLAAVELGQAGLGVGGLVVKVVGAHSVGTQRLG